MVVAMSKIPYEKLRKRVLESNLALVRYKLVEQTWGNTSEYDRKNQVIAIKPSGLDYEKMTLESIVIVDINGKVITGNKKPSVDLPTHLEIYRAYPDIGGIVHTHSKWATIWAQAGLSIPVYGTTHADFALGPIPCTGHLSAEKIINDYEKNIGVLITDVIQNPILTPAVLCAGHGSFSWGADSSAAVTNARTLEYIAEIAYHAKNLNPKVEAISGTLNQKHFYRKHGASRYYGQF